MKTKLGLLIGSLTLATVGLMARPAAAGLDSCGNIHVEASSMCKVEAEATCTGHCDPPEMQLACAGKLEVECSGMCNADVDVSCTAMCNVGTCTASCMIDPGKFDCSANCNVRADADCSAQCSGSASGSEAHGQCVASCKATISAECDSRCDIEPATASCEAKCQASCEGGCKGHANIGCQVDCQNNSYLDCEGELSVDCQADCMGDGAIFCDNQYVDHGNNAQDCINSLNAVITANVDTSASGHAKCEGNGCEAEGKASCSARMAPVAPGEGGAAVIAGLGLGMFLIGRRRRRA